MSFFQTTRRQSKSGPGCLYCQPTLSLHRSTKRAFMEQKFLLFISVRAIGKRDAATIFGNILPLYPSVINVNDVETNLPDCFVASYQMLASHDHHLSRWFVLSKLAANTEKPRKITLFLFTRESFRQFCISSNGNKSFLFRYQSYLFI